MRGIPITVSMFGKKINDMDRDELIRCITYLGQLNETLQGARDFSRELETLRPERK